MTFIQIADSMGIDLNKVAGGALNQSVPRASGAPRGLGYGGTIVNGQQFSMLLLNKTHGVRHLRQRAPVYWEHVLQNAINRRSTAINNDMARGVFKDMKTRAQRYPGLFVKP